MPWAGYPLTFCMWLWIGPLSLHPVPLNGPWRFDSVNCHYACCACAASTKRWNPWRVASARRNWSRNPAFFKSQVFLEFVKRWSWLIVSMPDSRTWANPLVKGNHQHVSTCPDELKDSWLPWLICAFYKGLYYLFTTTLCGSYDIPLKGP